MKKHIRVMATIKEDEATDTPRLQRELGRAQLDGSRQVNAAERNNTKLHSQTSRPRTETVGDHISRIERLVELEIDSFRDGKVSDWSAERPCTRADLLSGTETEMDWRGLTPKKHRSVLLSGQLRNCHLASQLGNIIEFIHALAKLECALIELGDITVTHGKNTGMIGSLGERSAAEKCGKELREDRLGFSSLTLAGDQSGSNGDDLPHSRNVSKEEDISSILSDSSANSEPLTCSNGDNLPHRRYVSKEDAFSSILSESSADSEPLPCSNGDYLPHRRNVSMEDDISSMLSETSVDSELLPCSNGDYLPHRRNVSKDDDISSILSESSADSEPLENQRRLDCLHLSAKKKALIRWILRKMCIEGRIYGRR